MNKLATQIVQQMALVNIPDPPPRQSPLPPPIVEIDLAAVHDRLNGLDHLVTDLTKLLVEKEETVLYVINKRPATGDLTTSLHTPVQSRITHHGDEQNPDTISRFESIIRQIQNKPIGHSKETRRRKNGSHHPSNQIPTTYSPYLDDDESSRTNSHRHSYPIQETVEEDEDETETSRDSEHTAVGLHTSGYQERTEDLTSRRMHSRHTASVTQSHGLTTTSVESINGYSRRLGEALASNGTDIIYYDYEQEMICLTGGREEHSIKFNHGLVVDLYWWAINNEWLILSEQGLYRWKAGDQEYHDAYEFTNGEIGFRRIAVTATGIFCLFRYSLMLLELTNSMQMKRLNALAPPDATYRKLADISIRKQILADGNEEETLGLIWFGSAPGIILEERLATSQKNNHYERSFRHVAVRDGRYARLAPYEDGRAWLISNTGADIFWIVDNANVAAGRREATSTWVRIQSGTPVNAVCVSTSTVCVRLQDGKIEYLASEQ